MTPREQFSDLWYTLARIRQAVVRRIVVHDRWSKRQDQFGASAQAAAARGVVQQVAEYVAMVQTLNGAVEAAFLPGDLSLMSTEDRRMAFVERDMKAKTLTPPAPNRKPRSRRRRDSR